MGKPSVLLPAAAAAAAAAAATAASIACSPGDAAGAALPATEPLAALEPPAGRSSGECACEGAPIDVASAAAGDPGRNGIAVAADAPATAQNTGAADDAAPTLAPSGGGLACAAASSAAVDAEAVPSSLSTAAGGSVSGVAARM